MLKQGFWSLILGGVLTLSPASAQTQVDWRKVTNLTPFQARIVSTGNTSSEGSDPSSLQLQIQIPEELAAHPVLHLELFSVIGILVYRFDLLTRSKDRVVRFLLPLPDDFASGFYILTAQAPDRTVKYSVRLPCPEEEILP